MYRPSLWIFVALIAAAAVIYVVLEPVKTFGYDGDALAESIEGEVPDDYGNVECQEVGRAWECGRDVDAESGFETGFLVTADDDGCWTAVPRTTTGPTGDQKMSACVDILDISGLSSVFDV